MKWSSYYLLKKETSYVAEKLIRYFEDQGELLTYLNKTVTNAAPPTPSDLKTTSRLFCYWKSKDVTCF